MATADCSLCGSSQTTVVESIDSEKIQKGYEKLCGANFNEEFGGIRHLTLNLCSNCGLKFFTPLVVGTSNFYGTLQKKLDWYYLAEKPEYKFAGQYINSDSQVCEIGCGEGRFFETINPRGYVGLELNESAVFSAKQKGINAKLESLEEHSVKNPEQYDVVCAFQVLEHVPSVRKFIEDAKRCLKPGGLLIFSVPDNESFLGSASNVFLNMPPHHQTLWTEDVFKAAAVHLGLKVENLHHETLSEEHRLFFLSTMIQNKLYKIFLKRPTFIDGSLFYRVIQRASFHLAQLLNPTLNKIQRRPRGFSLTAVLRRA